MQWDDNDITSFSQTQHAGSIALARQATQHVINELVSDNFLWDEQAVEHIQMTADTREYSLASDFVRFKDKNNLFFELEGASGTDGTSQFLSEYPGGEVQLQKQVPQYKSQSGTPQWYYFTDDTTVGIYPVPEDSGSYYRYTYEKNVMVENESDVLPFDSDQKAYAFTDMAARVFTFLFVPQPLSELTNDIIYTKAKAALMALLRKEPPQNKYGYRYG